jgi:5-methylcytosine-specific restriction protein B
MNTADRSLASIDVAVRRRFAFMKLWPQTSVVAEHGSDQMQGAFQRLISTFVDYASEESFDLLPGHSYFLERDERKAFDTLKTTLVPLLEDYLAQGYVASFAEQIRAYLQWINAQ